MALPGCCLATQVHLFCSSLNTHATLFLDGPRPDFTKTRYGRNPREHFFSTAVIESTLFLTRAGRRTFGAAFPSVMAEQFTACSFYSIKYFLLPFLAGGEAVGHTKPAAFTHKPAMAQAGGEAAVHVCRRKKEPAPVSFRVLKGLG